MPVTTAAAALSVVRSETPRNSAAARSVRPSSWARAPSGVLMIDCSYRCSTISSMLGCSSLHFFTEVMGRPFSASQAAGPAVANGIE
jgi:hypothetical protein